MALWIEIHCDVRADNPPGWYEKHLHAFCETEAGENVGALFANDGAFSAKMAALKRRAKELRWVWSRKHGWACPNCRTTL